ncbi:MAG TPA: VOC family protein [Acidimicrobiales bacterium]|jgi:catechol 2,3-dioxygenase-like lactoylglutathione lyase family enzyme
MSIEINHMIVPVKDRKAAARFLGEILGIEPGPVVVPHFEPLQVGGVTLDFADSPEVQPMHIAFLVDEATFDAGYARLLELGTTTFADPTRSQPGEINHRFGGRGVYFDDPDGHFFELMTALPR